MAQSKGHKQFPFKWRAAWLALGRSSPTAAYVWNYMFWRSDKDNIFDLEESLVCQDTGLERKTLCKARSLIAKHGGFKRLYSRNERGQMIVKYQMLGFEPQEQIPENGTSDKSQKTGLEPSTVLRNPVKRDHTVDTLSVDTCTRYTVDTSESVSEEEASFASLTQSSIAVGSEGTQAGSATEEPTAEETEFLKPLVRWKNPVSLAKEAHALRSILKSYLSSEDLLEFWNWNLKHKRGSKLEFFSMVQVLATVQSDSPKSGLAQWQKCRTSPCRKCGEPPNSARPPFEVDRYMAGIDNEIGIPERQPFEIEEDLGE